MTDKKALLKELENQMMTLQKELEEEEAPTKLVASEGQTETEVVEVENSVEVIPENKVHSKQYEKQKHNPDYREKNRLRSREWYHRKKDTDLYKEKRRLRVREYMRKQFENNTEVGQRMRDAAVLRYWRKKKETCSPEKYKRAVVMLEYRSPDRAAFVIENIGY